LAAIHYLQGKSLEMILAMDLRGSCVSVSLSVIFGHQHEVLELLFLLQKPTMTVGNHIVTGTVQPLKEPFCLMEKQYSDEAGHKVLQSYQIIGVVKQKYLFNSYPKVIMR
jgi:hypothetical protein